MDNQKILNKIFGKKVSQTQRFNEKQERMPVTVIEVDPCIVVQVKNIEKDNYQAVQIGFKEKKEKNTTKAILGHIKKAGITKIPRFLREVTLDKTNIHEFKPGEIVKIDQVFSVGDKVNVIGISRGMGFSGVVKRHHFHGGPRTHGQSDRERAPGSIGQTTTPGRVYKGKRMAGRSGSDQVTIKNLKVIEIDSVNNRLIVSGLVPGPRNNLITIVRVN